jgi:hypothetical protein
MYNRPYAIYLRICSTYLSRMCTVKYLIHDSCVWIVARVQTQRHRQPLPACKVIIRNTILPYMFFFFFFCNFSRQGFSVFPWLSWNSLCRPGWPWTQKSACLCLPSAGIKGVHHHCPAGCHVCSYDIRFLSFLECSPLPVGNCAVSLFTVSFAWIEVM